MSEATANSRNAIRAAMHKADLVRTSTIERIDPYEREARSLIISGLSADDVTERIIQRMALKLKSSSSTQCVFTIQQSSVYSTLTVNLMHNRVVDYELL